MNKKEISIEDWCIKFNLYKYIINDDNTICVNHDVDYCSKRLFSIPIQFGVVNGRFDFRDNLLRTLKGSPKKVNFFFGCDSNRLTNLKGGPMEVDGDYYCYRNKLISLEGGPIKLGGKLDCMYNPIFAEYNRFESYQNYFRNLKINSIFASDEL
jgi:hypothetical protein